MIGDFTPDEINDHAISDSGSYGAGETYDGGDGTDDMVMYGDLTTTDADLIGIENYILP